jgi:flagellar motor component MotA
MRIESLKNEEDRYQELKKKLEKLKRNGQAEMEAQKQRIEDDFAKKLEDFKA